MAALMLGTVLEQTRRKYQLRLLAGGDGLHRSLRWLYFSEDISNADFFRGGELMVLTGHSFSDGAELDALVSMLISRNACGVIVNVGKYILEEEISPELIALCDRENFPLITMPWKFHLTDILQDFSRQIFFRTHEQDRLIYIFQMLLKDSKLFALEDETRLLANQFDPMGNFCVGLLSYQTAQGGKLPPAVPQDIMVLAENHLNPTPEKICVFTYRNQLVLIAHKLEVEQVALRMRGLRTVCEGAFPSLLFHCGIGSVLAGVAGLKEGYRRATAALYYGMYRGMPQLCFGDMEVFQLFFACQDQTILSALTKVLQPLEEYDRQYSSQLTETLQQYLRFNGSVNQVAEEMYCHRNTTNYRMKKIKSLLGSDLDGSDILFRLQLAYYVREFQAIYFSDEEMR